MATTKHLKLRQEIKEKTTKEDKTQKVVVVELKKEPRVKILDDFYRYRTISAEDYHKYRKILLESDSEMEKNLVMRKIRDAM